MHKFIANYRTETPVSEHFEDTATGPISTYKNSAQESQAAFLLKLSQRFHLPNNSIQYVVDSIKALFEKHLSELRSKICEVSNSDTQQTIFKHCEKLFDCSVFFDGLDCHKKLENYYSNLDLYIRPQAVRLGVRQRSRLVDNIPTDVEVAALGYFIPFFSKLAIVLSLPEVAIRIHYRSPRDAFMTCVSDGKYFKNHPFMQQHPDALVINLLHSME